MLKLVLGTLFLASICNAQTITPLWEQNMTTPSYSQITVLNLDFPPGNQGTPPHTHSGPVVGYVVKGDFLFQVEGGQVSIVKKGGVFTEEIGAVHLWGANANADRECKVVVSVIGAPGAPVLTMVDDKAHPRADYTTAIREARRNARQAN